MNIDSRSKYKLIQSNAVNSEDKTKRVKQKIINTKKVYSFYSKLNLYVFEKHKNYSKNNKNIYSYRFY